MTAVATRESHAREREVDSAERPAPRLFEPHGATLEDAILATWDELMSSDHATCPVCSGEMSRTSGCDSCGSELA
jgi:hypothetical protein